MFNQNIISNKFDLNLSTMLSSYWCTAIFMKSCSLHYILKSRGKRHKVNDTEENDAFQIDHKKKPTLETEKQKFTRQRRHAEETLNDANQTRTKDLKITKSSHLL